MDGAIAVDFGASSGRFAAGTLVDGRIHQEIIEQRAHAPVERGGQHCWDLEFLLGLCRRAVQYGEGTFDSCTIGIDSWGVDIGFLPKDAGIAPADPICYRDSSHEQAARQLQTHRDRIFELTGIQDQPFNTINQLLARKIEDPSVVDSTWLPLPDYLGVLLGASQNFELTEASTTALMGQDSKWSPELFDLIGYPLPAIEPALPGTLAEHVSGKVRLARVGSHDTASAVAGLGQLSASDAFLNVGTWSLIGTVIDHPIVTPQARSANFTNERCVNGKVRLLKNVPGFYIINRLHEDLAGAQSVASWLARGVQESTAELDVFDTAYFNPSSMVLAASQILGDRAPKTSAGWAELALRSLVAALSRQPDEIEALTGRVIDTIRVGGGGSQSEAFCQAMATQSRRRVIAGPAEATVLGNLGVQFLASGQIQSEEELNDILRRSTLLREYEPQ